MSKRKEIKEAISRYRDQGMTYDEIGQIFGKSRQWAYQLDCIKSVSEKKLDSRTIEVLDLIAKGYTREQILEVYKIK